MQLRLVITRPYSFHDCEVCVFGDLLQLVINGAAISVVVGVCPDVTCCLSLHLDSVTGLQHSLFHLPAPDY